MANLRASVVVEISAAPEAVFAALSDPSKMPDWISGVQSSEWEGDPAPRPGGRFKIQYRYGRRINDITMEITVAESGSRFEYHTVEGPYPIEASFILESSGNATVVTYSQNALSDSKLALIGFMLTGWFAKSIMRRTLRRDLGKLEAMVESASAGDR